jgi:hypothetical protein
MHLEMSTHNVLCYAMTFMACSSEKETIDQHVES